jgi:pimeloyl-ACP methyl ester carboxylesterase
VATVRNGSVSIHYEVEGRGPPLVLHTGAGGDLRIWRYAGYTAALPDYRLILVDQRGRGSSDRPDSVEEHRMERYVSDVVAVLDDTGEESAGFWGYSNGFLVGVAFGAAHPGRLRALVGTGAVPAEDLADRSPITDPEAFVAAEVAGGGIRVQVGHFMHVEHDRFPEDIERNVLEADPRMGALRRVAWRSWRGPRSALARVAAPILVLQGAKEDTEGETERALATAARAQLVTLEGQGHLGAFYRKNVTLPYVLPFLRQHLR